MCRWMSRGIQECAGDVSDLFFEKCFCPIEVHMLETTRTLYIWKSYIGVLHMSSMNQTYTNTGTDSLRSYYCILVRFPQRPVHVAELFHEPPFNSTNKSCVWWNRTPVTWSLQEHMGAFEKSGLLKLLGSKLKLAKNKLHPVNFGSKSCLLPRNFCWHKVLMASSMSCQTLNSQKMNIFTCSITCSFGVFGYDCSMFGRFVTWPFPRPRFDWRFAEELGGCSINVVFPNVTWWCHWLDQHVEMKSTKNVNHQWMVHTPPHFNRFPPCEW